MQWTSLQDIIIQLNCREGEGHYGYQRLSEPESGFENLMTTRRIIDEFEEYAGREIHITEFTPRIFRIIRFMTLS